MQHTGCPPVCVGCCLAICSSTPGRWPATTRPNGQRDAGYLLGQTSRQDYLAGFSHNIGGVTSTRSAKTQQTATICAPTALPDDTVLVWGFQTLVNYLADRQAPTRYIFTYPLTFDRPETAFRVRGAAHIPADMAESGRHSTSFVTNDVNPLQAVDSYQLLAGFPEFQQHHPAELPPGKRRSATFISIGGSMHSYKIALIPGDGIGQEVLPEGMQCDEKRWPRMAAFACIPKRFPGAASIT